jgi:hypothetical protein
LKLVYQCFRVLSAVSRGSVIATNDCSDLPNPPVDGSMEWAFPVDPPTEYMREDVRVIYDNVAAARTPIRPEITVGEGS